MQHTSTEAGARMAEVRAPHESPHPNVRVYVKVALVLAVITGAEIALSYMDIPDWSQIASLLVLSLIKFTAVVGYFMHLKFDHPQLRRPFLAGLITALLVYGFVVGSMLLHAASSS